MKKIIMTLMILMFSITLVSCNKNEEKEPLEEINLDNIDLEETFGEEHDKFFEDNEEFLEVRKLYVDYLMQAKSLTEEEALEEVRLNVIRIFYMIDGNPNVTFDTLTSYEIFLILIEYETYKYSHQFDYLKRKPVEDAVLDGLFYGQGPVYKAFMKVFKDSGVYDYYKDKGYDLSEFDNFKKNRRKID
ncbi:MAG: hypothetical protein MJ245_03015 [Clostridia bacterium]|nr:hypothetical protein [Clostridia bacterium]